MRTHGVALNVDPTTLTRSQRAWITGRLALRFNDGHRDVFFPRADWSDFPVVLLSAWLPMLRAVAERRSIGADCHFMDGPFSFAVHATDDDFTLHVIDRQTSARADWTVPAAQFLLALREAGRVVLDACDAAGWDSGDIQALRTELE